MLLKLKVMVCSALFSVAAFAEDAPVKVAMPTPPEIAAKAYFVIDAQTGYVIAEKSADERVEPASLTKMLTAYIVEDEIAKGKISPDDLTTVSENAWAKKFPGSSLMFIRVGTQVSIHDLLKGVIISSGNDATVALAEHISGSVDVFAGLMNEYAQKLGMTSSHFMNPHGLPDAEHYTTSRDLATLAKAIIYDFPEQYKTYAEKSFQYNNIDQPNRNRLLWSDSTVDGLKTGHTSSAGYCLVTSAMRDNMRVITVVMGTNSEAARARETQKLLAYAYRNFKTTQVFKAGDKVAQVRVWAGAKKELDVVASADMAITNLRGKANAELTTTPNIQKYITAPIKKGDVLGEVVVSSVDGKEYKQAIVAAEDIEEAGFFSRIWELLHLFILKMFPTS